MLASAPSTPTHAHRPWRAHQKTPTDSARYSDSEYTAEKKNAIGASAVTSTASRATSPRGWVASRPPARRPSSSVHRRWIPYSATANATSESATPAAIGGSAQLESLALQRVEREEGRPRGR